MSQDTSKTKEKGYRKLVAWQKANELAFEIYQATKDFPNDERYGMISQLRRSALSIPTNLVEGLGRQGKKELKQFSNIALGSLAETEYLLEFSQRLGYLNQDTYNHLDSLRNEVGKILWGFYQGL
jgi:four helix bundle protein